MNTFSEIYSTLSQVDLSKFTEKKMGLTYLSWANAWGVLMKHFPSSTYQILPSETYYDGSVMVWVEVTICDHRRKMWLPVMNHKNQAICNPSSRDVSDANMRCLVKCLSLFGLGLYIYQGEDLPRQEERDYTDDQMTQFKALLEFDDAMGMAVFMRGLEEKAQAALFNAAPQGKKTEVKNKVREMLSSAQAVAKEYADGIKEAIQNQDVTALIEYKSELDANTKRILMPLLDSDEIKTLKEIKGE
jgi:hypothetical protein